MVLSAVTNRSDEFTPTVENGIGHLLQNDPSSILGDNLVVDQQPRLYEGQRVGGVRRTRQRTDKRPDVVGYMTDLRCFFQIGFTG